MSQLTRITIIGDLNMDLTATSTKRPAAGETILGERFETFPGGKGANQAVGAAWRRCYNDRNGWPRSFRE